MIRMLFATAMAIALVGCDDSASSSKSVVTVPDPGPAPSPTPTPGVTAISPQGGSASLAGVAEFQFPNGFVRSDTQIRIYQASLSELPEEYLFNTKMFYAQNALPKAIVVQLGTDEPTGAVSAKISLPTDYFSSKPSNMAFAVMGGTVNASDEDEVYDTYELIDPVVDQVNHKILFDAGASYFTQRDSSNRVVARFVIVQVPGPQK